MRALWVVLGFTIGGCICWPDDRACVQGTGVCYDLPGSECLGADDARDARDCYSTPLVGTCAEHGYTVRCGAYSVRPGSSC